MIDLDDWWKQRIEEDKSLRLQDEALARDPGYPATYGTCTGEPTEHPWSACIGAINRLQKIIDYNVTAATLRKAWGI